MAPAQCPNPVRRKLVAAALGGLVLAGCAGPMGGPARVAFQRSLYGQVYAIDLGWGFSLPVTAEQASVFRQVGPLEWYQVRDAQTIERVVADFNAHHDAWRQMPAYSRNLLWHRPEAPDFP
ncbi:MAG: hypothetical protein ACOY3L_02195 [Pseudomonadota bacterium]